MKRKCLWICLVGVIAAFFGCGDGDRDKFSHDEDGINDNSQNDSVRDRHLVKFVPGRQGQPNEIHIFYATDKDGVVMNLVKDNRVAKFDPNCDRKVCALIESHCTGYPEVVGGGPGLRILYENSVVFKIDKPGDIMIPGLIIDDREIYSLNTDFVDVEGPKDSIRVSNGLISWGTGAICPSFVCEEGTKSSLPEARDWE